MPLAASKPRNSCSTALPICHRSLGTKPNRINTSRRTSIAREYCQPPKSASVSGLFEFLVLEPRSAQERLHPRRLLA
jgi:hypothetical protein